MSYAEISQFNAICEVAYKDAGYHPELSYGSHMFQDLVEADVYYGAINDNRNTRLYQPELLRRYPEVLEALLPGEAELTDIVKLYDLSGGRASLILDAGQGGRCAVWAGQTRDRGKICPAAPADVREDKTGSGSRQEPVCRSQTSVRRFYVTASKSLQPLPKALLPQSRHHKIRCPLGLLTPISHRNPHTRILQHRHVVLPVPHSRRFLRLHPEMLQHLLNSPAFSSPEGQQIHRISRHATWHGRSPEGPR